MDILILKTLPIIFTKDHRFAGSMAKKKTRGGDVLILPDDAILVMPPDKTDSKATPQ